MLSTIIDYVFFICFVSLTMYLVVSTIIMLVQTIKKGMKRKKLTAGQYAFDEFLDREGYFKFDLTFQAPPMSTDEALEIIRFHFAESFVVPYSCNKEQFNTELVHYILSNYKGNKV